MAERKCDQFDRERKRQCRRNATTTTPWGDACDKCAEARATSVLVQLKWSSNVEWAIREIVRQEMRKKHG